MNDTKIESLLRQAPCPPAPAGLNQQLLADIRLPRAQQSASLGTAVAALFWRRWVPSLSFGLFFLGCLIVLGMQTSQLLNLRRENKSLRAVTAGLEQLREENAELEKLRAASQEAERRRKASEELLKLKVEVDELRGRAQELPALRAENQRLQAERVAAVAKAGITPEADPLAEQMAKAERVQCVNNLKQICLAALIQGRAGWPAVG